MNLIKYLLKIMFNLSCVFIFIGITTCAQTIIVTPTLTLNAPGIEDQDDMCIWVSADASQSTVIASDKAAKKLFVYDLDGNVIQTISVPGKPGNIDIRYNFILSGVPTDIVGYNDRDNETMVFYKVDRTTRELLFVGNFDDGHLTNVNYGFCLYHNPFSGKYYAVASSNSTQMRQWELIDNGDGTIGGIEKRTWNNGTGDITEGLVADDETGKLYCANEGEGIYKYDADPTDPNPVGELIAPTGENGLTPDVEGITIYYAANGEGYLIASSQGSDNFKVYERKEPHNFVETIEVSGVNNTDGIDVTNVSLGTNFPLGLFLTHNGSGSGPYPIMGSKYEDLGLTVDTSYWNPLPVELMDFGVKIIDNKVKLTWQTATESNNKGFEIQRKINNDKFTEIGFVSGHGTTSEINEYSFVDENLKNGKYIYRLKQLDFDGTYEYSKQINVSVNLKFEYSLEQNFPNPFNPSTRINFSVPKPVNVSLKVYNMLGQEVKTLVDELKEKGSYEVNFDAEGLVSGIYFYKIAAGDFSQIHKMIFIK